MSDVQNTETPVDNNQAAMPKVISPGDAVMILIEAVEIAQNKGGVYTLEDAELLAVAKRVLKSILVPAEQVPASSPEPTPTQAG